MFFPAIQVCLVNGNYNFIHLPLQDHIYISLQIKCQLNITVLASALSV